MFSVSDRISVSGALGTVLYVGHLPHWGTEVLAYGVEWDDVTRGKNNGEIDGIQYFSPKQQGAASFIKATNKKIETPCSFFDAVFSRYSNEANAPALEARVAFGSKIVENYGFRKLNEISNDVANLAVVMVDHQNISSAGKAENHEFGPNLTAASTFKAKTLDLSSNLLSQWREVLHILEHFPSVKSVNLNGNRLNETSLLELHGGNPIFPRTVRHVCLSATYLSPLALSLLNLENVTKLELSENSYVDSQLSKWELPSNLAFLDLSYNNLQRIPDICNTNTLTHLVLANNQIASLAKSSVFAKVKVLDLRRNPLKSFEEVDLLAEMFPNLCELRLNDCPVFEGLSADEMAFNLIGRLRCEPWNGNGNGNGIGKPSRAISKLNGSYLSESEITNAELYFISRVRSDELRFSNTKKWHELLAKHGISETVSQPVSTVYDDSKIRLSIRKASDPHTELFTRVFLQKNPVLRLKGVIAKNIGKFILDFSIFYYVNDDDNVDYGSREIMDDDIATLQSHGFLQNHRIYVL